MLFSEQRPVEPLQQEPFRFAAPKSAEAGGEIVRKRLAQPADVAEFVIAVKSSSAVELIPAVETVLRGEHCATSTAGRD